MNQIEQKHFDAAGAISEIIANRLGSGRAVHSETAIASAARLAGTMMLRSFGIDMSTMPSGSVLLSEQANEEGPALLNIVIIMMQQYGLQPNQQKLAHSENRGEEPQLSVLDAQELLEDDLNAVLSQHNLTLIDGAAACALTTAWMIKECAPAIGLEVGFHIAAFGFIEGSKTVPRNKQNVLQVMDVNRP